MRDAVKNAVRVILGCAALALSTLPGRPQALSPPWGLPDGIACAYNNTLPTLTTGQVGWVQCDANGRLITSPLGGTITTVPTTGATMTTSQPTVTTTAAALTFSGTAHRELINPPGNATIYIGSTNAVTTATGYPVFQGASYDLTRYTGSVYVISTVSQTIGLISY